MARPLIPHRVRVDLKTVIVNTLILFSDEWKKITILKGPLYSPFIFTSVHMSGAFIQSDVQVIDK